MKLTVVFLCLFILYMALILPGIPIYSVFLYWLRKKKLVLFFFIQVAFSSSAALLQVTDITSVQMAISYFLLFCNYIILYCEYVHMMMNVSWLNVGDVCNMDQYGPLFRHEDLISAGWCVIR